jgi:hypothetical protein
MSSNIKYLTAIPTAAVFLYSYVGAVNLPERNIAPIKKETGVMAMSTAMKIPWEDSCKPHYKFVSDNQIIEEQINIIHDFVSVLLEESQDLDPKYSKVVDKYFWELA